MGEEEKLKKIKKQKSFVTEFGDQGTPRHHFQSFVSSDFTRWCTMDFRHPFYEASYILFIFTLSVNVKYANNTNLAQMLPGKSLATSTLPFK